MFVDTHAHLSYSQFDDDREDVIARAAESGVTRVVDVGTNLNMSRRAVALAEAHEGVFATVGFHPHDVDGVTEEALQGLLPLLAHEKVVAVGETGLDYFRDYAPRDLQERVFRHHIRVAKETGLPLVVHSRGAEERVLELLADEGGGEVVGVLHCFGGGAALARRAIDQGFFLGFGGTVTYPRSTAAAVAATVPEDRLLLETDCPYLAPQAVRGKRNEPSGVQLVAAFLADLLGIPEDALARTTSANAERLYGLPATSASEDAPG